MGVSNAKRIFVVGLLALTGCASIGLEDEFRENRGYTDAEINMILPYRESYLKLLIRSSSRYTAAVTEVSAEARVRQIFCTCIKRLGNRCRQRPVGFTGEERLLWVKSNAAEMALSGHDSMKAGNLLDDDAGMIDPAECG